MKKEICYEIKDLKEMDRVKRLKLINSISGIKSANLIGTKSLTGVTNLCIISSVTHIGSNPALIGFICRPNNKVKRDSSKLVYLPKCKEKFKNVPIEFEWLSLCYFYFKQFEVYKLRQHKYESRGAFVQIMAKLNAKHDFTLKSMC